MGNPHASCGHAQHAPSAKAAHNATSATPGTLLVTYFYNNRGQITDKTFTDGTAEHYTYYADGKLWTAANQNISYTYVYYDDGRLHIDRARHTVESEGAAVHLTKKEFDLLWLLIRSGGRVVSRETILSRLWDYAADIETRTVDVHIRSLRKKIGDHVIDTVVGVGYKFAR